jgi:hypothetical protein
MKTQKSNYYDLDVEHNHVVRPKPRSIVEEETRTEVKTPKPEGFFSKFLKYW